MVEDTSVIHRSESVSVDRVTSHPEGEKASPDAGTAGEATGAALADNPANAAFSTNAAETGSLLRITRASCRIRVDPQLLAVDPYEHRKRRCGGVEAGCAACQLQKELHEIQRACARAANAAARVLERVDSDVYDQCLLALGRPPKGDEWREYGLTDREAAVRAVLPGCGKGEARALAEAIVSLRGAKKRPTIYTYPLIRKVAPEVLSGTASAITKAVETKWGQDRFDALVRQSKRPPRFTVETYPIPLRAADVRLTKCDGDREQQLSEKIRRKRRGQWYELRFTLRAGGGERWCMPIEVHDDYERRLLADVVHGRAKLGEIKLSRDRMHPGEWYARIAYTRIVPEQVGPLVVAVRPGMVALVTMAANNGERFQYFGDDLEAHLRITKGRRIKRQNVARSSGRIGHGRGRTLQPTEIMQGGHERFVQTWIQTRTRRHADWIHALDAGAVVVMPEFSAVRDGPVERLKWGKWVWDRIQEWPRYQYQMALIAKLQEMGHRTIPDPQPAPDAKNPRLRKEPVEGIDPSHACPECLSDDVEIDLTHRRRRLRCRECGHVEQLDMALTRLCLRRGVERLGDADEATSASDGNHTGGTHGRKRRKGTARKAGRKCAKGGRS